MTTINNETTTDAPNPVIVAEAHYGFKRLIVTNCPFCHKEHSHSNSTNDGEKRMADCFLGEYIIKIAL